jgi:transposase
MKEQRRRFSRDFKLRAVELSNHRPNIRELARELDINPELLYRWRRELAEKNGKSFPGNGNSSKSDAEAELERLRKELADTRMERDILKKAVSIFSESDGKGSAS